MSKKIDLGQSGLGDIWDVLHDRGVSDLSWLDVNQEDYREAEALPKQNLDIIPELQRALTFEDSDVPSLIPLKQHTIVNTNPLDPPGSQSRNVSTEIVNRVVRHVIAGHPASHIKERIFLEFVPEQIRAASEGISSVMRNVGLMGGVFIDSKHFPRCAQDSDDKKFVATKASSAKFVLAKSECSGCVHNRDGICSNLHKVLVGSVPYDRKTFAGYALELAEQGRLDKSEIDTAISGSDEDRRRVLQSSFCSPVKVRPVDTHGGISLRQQRKAAKPTFTDKQIDEYLSRPKKVEKVLSRSFIAAARHLMNGGLSDAIAGSVDPEVQKLSRSYGLIGHTYLDMDALGGCQKTLDFMSKMDFIPDFVVRRSSTCGQCKDASDGACSQIRTISSITDSDRISKRHFVSALSRAVDRGAITTEMARRATNNSNDNSNWRSLTAQANLIVAENAVPSYSGSSLRAHTGASIPSREMSSVLKVDEESVRKAVSHMMNCGLSGRSLRDSILQKFAKEDLSQVPRVGSSLSKYDGVQGTYFIDPTAYSDYGKGCSTGSKHFRKTGASNVLVGKLCTGCSLQTAPGWCSKYSKPLIRSVPKSVIVSALNLLKTQKVEHPPVENPVSKYELSSEIVVDPDKKKNVPEIDFASRNITD